MAKESWLSFKFFKASVDDLARSSVNKFQIKVFAEKYKSHLMRAKVLSLLVSGVSVFSGLCFLNYKISGSTELMQLATMLSMVLLVLLELFKTSFIDNSLESLGAQWHVKNTAHRNYTESVLFGIFSVGFVVLSFFVSVNGTKLFFTESKQIVEKASEMPSHQESLDSISAIFDQQILNKKNALDVENDELEQKIANIKAETKDLWSPQAKANSKVIPIIENQIIVNNERFADFENKILEKKQKNIDDFLASKEKVFQRNLNEVKEKIDDKGSSYGVITWVCEILCVLCKLFIFFIEYNISKQTHDTNADLPVDSDVIPIVKNEQAVEPMARKMQSLERQVMTLTALGTAENIPFTPVNQANTGTVQERQTPGFVQGGGNKISMRVQLYDGKTIELNQYNGSLNKVCFACGTSIQEHKNNAFCCSDACYQNFHGKYGTMKDILGNKI